MHKSFRCYLFQLFYLKKFVSKTKIFQIRLENFSWKVSLRISIKQSSITITKGFSTFSALDRSIKSYKSIEETLKLKSRCNDYKSERDWGRLLCLKAIRHAKPSVVQYSNLINPHFIESRRLTLKLVGFLKKKANKKKCLKGFSEIRTYRSGIGDRGGSMKGKGPHEGGGHLVVYRASSWYYLGAWHARHCLERLLLGGMILTNFQINYHAMSDDILPCYRYFASPFSILHYDEKSSGRSSDNYSYVNAGGALTFDPGDLSE